MTNVFYVPGQTSIIDFAIIVDGNPVTHFHKKSLEELKKEYPNVTIVTLDEFERTIKKAMITAPVEIEPETYFRALGELPPEDHRQGSGGTSFKMSEYLTGPYTNIYAIFNDRYWSFVDRGSITHEEILKRIQEQER